MISTIVFELTQRLIAESPDGDYPIIKLAGILVADDDALFNYWKGDKNALDEAYKKVAKMPTEETTKLVQDFFTKQTASSEKVEGSVKPLKVKKA